jgi:hypothetical protein
VMVLGSVVVAAFLEGTSGAEAKAAAPSPILADLLIRLRPVLQRYYPDAQSRLRGDLLEFEHDTRVFLIHSRLKTGGWQEAREMRGPNTGGILGTIELRDGPYNGAAVLPQTFNNRYFETLVMAEASDDQSQYLYVHLSYPDSVKSGFLAEFREVVRAAWRKGQ